MSAPGIGNLSTLIKRLEAATSRLEDIAAVQHQPGPAATSPAAVGAAGLVGAAAGASAGVAASKAAATPVDLPASVEAYDEDVKPKIDAFVELSGKIGGNVQEQAKSVVAAFAGVRQLLLVAGHSQKPAGTASAPSPVFLKLLEPIQGALLAATNVRESNRGDRQHFNHLSAISEGLPAVGWVAVEPKPGPYVEEMKNSGQFYLNRVIKEFKDTDKTHVEWCRAFTALLDATKAYVMQHHTTGVTWNPKGGDAASFSSAAADVPPPPPAPPAAAGGPPPPPPPPPPASAAVDSSAGGGMDAVFGQINKGEAITGGLRKVDPSQMTHKNPALRSGGAPPPTSTGKPAPPKPGSKPGSVIKAKKPAKTALEGNKWSVEYHEGNRSIVIDETSLGQTVNVFGCKDSVIHVKGKINAIQMVSCVKTSILLDTLLSSLELTSSPSFTVQVTGAVPTILIDSCDSGQIYLGPDSLQAEIITAKSSAINVSVPKQGGPEGEYVEIALPEQLRHSITSGGKSIKSEVVEHSG